VSPVAAAHDGIKAARPGSEAYAAARLRALTRFAKSMSAAHSVEDVIRIAARETQRDLRAAVASISEWERASGRLRVRANHGRLVPGEAAFPRDESYPVSDFPAILLSEDDLGPWIQVADDKHGDPKRVEMLRKRGRHCALIAPIVFDNKTWGELFAARTADQPEYDRDDMDFAAALTAQIAAGLAKADHMRQIERLAYTDQLTGLANRRAFDERLDRAIDRHTADGTVVSLIVCDVNGLKRMNDGHGHDHGDALLVQLAGAMSAAAAMLPGSLAARLGGDEFCVLIEGYGAEDAVQVAEELCNLALRVRGGEGVACGVASTGDRVGDVTTRDRLFRLADAAQYRAKRSRSLHPVIAGRGQPPDAALIVATGQGQHGAVAVLDPRTAAPESSMVGPHVTAGGLVTDRRTFRGRSSGIRVEILLTEAFSALDALAHGAGEDGAKPSKTPLLDRVEAVADVVARGLDSASWYIYLRPEPGGRLEITRHVVYRTPAESALEADEEPLAGSAVFEFAAPPVGPELLSGLGEEMLRAGGWLDLSAGAAEEGLAPDAARLASAGYTGVLALGATAPDRSEWVVSILLDSISRPPAPAAPLLRALLSAALLQ
jgi:diguanylate cyclase (GGDEF)-like protein